MFKRSLVVVLFLLTLPIGALADTDFVNLGGALTGGSSGLSLSGSSLIAVSGLNGGGLTVGANLGSVTLSTGALTSGSLLTGGLFGSGGSFTITGSGSNGVPYAVLFSGTFTSPVSWTMLVLPGGLHQYLLSGILSGATGNGFTVLTINTGKCYFDGKSIISAGLTNIVAVPEGSALAMLSMVLVVLFAAIWQKRSGGSQAA